MQNDEVAEAETKPVPFLLKLEGKWLAEDAHRKMSSLTFHPQGSTLK
jgi:hypothetical protein